MVKTLKGDITHKPFLSSMHGRFTTGEPLDGAASKCKELVFNRHHCYSKLHKGWLVLQIGERRTLISCTVLPMGMFWKPKLCSKQCFSTTKKRHLVLHYLSYGHAMYKVLSYLSVLSLLKVLPLSSDTPLLFTTHLKID